MKRFTIYRHIALAGAVALVAGVGSASATSYRLTNPSQWANTSAAEVPPLGDATTGTVNGDSWLSDSTPASPGGNEGQNFIYFQGAADSNDPAVANPTNGVNPQLLFDSVNRRPDNDPPDTQVSISQLLRVAWDTKKSSASTSGGHWFFDIFTRPKGDESDAGSFFAHNINFALLQDSGANGGTYQNNEFNTLEANKDNSTSAGGLEVKLYDHRRVGSGNEGDPNTDDRDEFPAKTLSQWTTAADNGNAPDWWDEDIRFAAMSSITDDNPEPSTFVSNLDNFQFDYDTGSASDQIAIDLGVGAGGGGNAVPEPGNLLMLGLALGMIGLSVRGRRNRA